jgi:predicted nucleic acid-binding protein
MTPLFDTNILIDYLNGVPEARQELDRYAAWTISIITWAEVMAGATAHKEKQTRSVLSAFVCLPVTMPVAERAAAIRRDEKMKLPDAIILATAETANHTLVTRNTRDFSSTDPRVRVPYTL